MAVYCLIMSQSVAVCWLCYTLSSPFLVAEGTQDTPPTAEDIQDTLPIIVGMGVPLMVLLLIAIVAVAIVLMRKRLQIIASSVRTCLQWWVCGCISDIWRDSADIVLPRWACSGLLQIYLPHTVGLMELNTCICGMAPPTTTEHPPLTAVLRFIFFQFNFFPSYIANSSILCGEYQCLPYKTAILS